MNSRGTTIPMKNKNGHKHGEYLHETNVPFFNSTNETKIDYIALNRNENFEEYIGDAKIGTDEVAGDISSDLQKILRNLHNKTCNGPSTLNKLEGFPPWISKKYLIKNHDNNC